MMKAFVIALGVAFFAASSLPAQTGGLTVVVLGSSSANGKNLDEPKYGGAADGLSSSWVNRFAAYLASRIPGSKVINLSKSGSSSFEALPTGAKSAEGRPAVDPQHNVTAALALKPDVLIVSFVSLLKGSSVQENLDNLSSIKKAADEKGVPVWICTATCPRNDADPADIKSAAEFRQRLLATFGERTVDFWPVLSQSDGTLNPKFALTDAPKHPNAEGHKLLFDAVVAADIPAALKKSKPLPGK